MKELKYKWDDDIWLLHIELKNKDGYSKSASYSRIMNNGTKTKLEPGKKVSVRPGESYRFIISRASVDETGLSIKFNEDLFIEIFRLQDRAYLPSNEDRYYSNGDVN